MKKKLYIVFSTIPIITLLFVITVSAEDDIQGWDKTRWGMAPKSVAEIYNIEIKQMDFKNGYDYFDLFPYKPDQFPNHNIRAFFNKKDGLNRIYEYFEISEYDINSMNLPEGKKPEVVFAMKCYDIKETFNSLEEKMVIKYGSPQLIRREDDEQRLMWVFPSTVIRLKHIGNSKMCTTTIDFTPKELNMR